MADEKRFLEPHVRDIDDNVDSHGSIHHSVSPYPRSILRSLIDHVRNQWRASTKYGLRSKSKSPSTKYPRGAKIALSIVTAPRFRRYILVYLVMVLACWFSWTEIVAPRLKEHADLMESLDLQTMVDAGGWFGTNSLPRFTDMVHMRNLDLTMIPGAQDSSSGDPSWRRLIVVSDVSGHTDELEELLEKVSFDTANGDHLIFTGNMVSDSIKSASVIDLAQKHHASCVRGLNEDRVLLVRRQMHAPGMVPLAGPSEIVKGGDNGDHMDQESFSHGDYMERALAAELRDDQVDWLESCPVILRVGQINGMGEVVVVHGGLVPGVELGSQDPSSVMNMRTIDLRTHVPSVSEEGMPWFKLFNKYQSVLLSTLKKSSADTAPPESRTTTVLYGHGVDNTLNLGRYTKGLDTGCHRGGKLTAMVISDGGKQKTVQARCKAST